MATGNQGHPQGQHGQGQGQHGAGQGQHGAGQGQHGPGQGQHGQPPLGQHMGGQQSGQQAQGSHGQGQPGRGNGGAGQGARDTMRQVGRQVQDGAEQMRHRFEGSVSSAREGISRGYRDAETMVSRNPSSSLLVSFGIGFGIGVVVASMLAREDESSTERWLDRHTPDSLRDLPGMFRGLPDSFEQLADAVRKLPDEISRRLPSSLRGR